MADKILDGIKDDALRAKVSAGVATTGLPTELVYLAEASLLPDAMNLLTGGVKAHTTAAIAAANKAANKGPSKGELSTELDEKLALLEKTTDVKYRIGLKRTISELRNKINAT